MQHTQSVEVLVIGAGQAGLATAFYLQKKGVNFLVIDGASAIGHSWRERYDSLVLFTPRCYSALPGLVFPGDPQGYATKDEVADYLARYAKKFAFPVALKTQVTALTWENTEFTAQTAAGSIRAKKVIIATGPFQTPLIPALAAELNPNITQLHSGEYRRPGQIPEGPVLVVGGGSSGSQIAVELAKTHPVTLAIGHKLQVRPYRLLGKNIYWWYIFLGYPLAHPDSWYGKWLRRKGDHIYGGEIFECIKDKRITLAPRLDHVTSDNAVFADGSQTEIKTIIWATGFKPDFSWVQIPNVIDGAGKPLHTAGVSQANPNLFFIGLPWLMGKFSATLGWVGNDAKRLVTTLVEQK